MQNNLEKYIREAVQQSEELDVVRFLSPDELTRLWDIQKKKETFFDKIKKKS